MSHSRERSEKTCLNCYAALHGRFCHVCGQENLDPRESFWGMVMHFFNDITHFDGKFFKTVRNLLVKPGYLAVEYFRGRRARYLHPIRLYIFTSAIFFLAFYSLSLYSSNSDTPGNIGIEFDNDAEKGLRDSVLRYSSVAQYDSIQASLPEARKDGWFKTRMIKSFIKRSNKYGGNLDEVLFSMIDRFVHSFPTLLFILLPLTGLFLKLLYFKNEKNIYTGHLIFLVYLYVFTFIITLIFFGLNELAEIIKSGWIRFLQAGVILYILWYHLHAMKNYYSEGWGLTILKFTVLNFLALISTIFLFVLFILITLIRV